MDSKLIAAYEAVYADLNVSIGFRPVVQQEVLAVLAQRIMELEHWDKFIPLDEVPD